MRPHTPHLPAWLRRYQGPLSTVAQELAQQQQRESYRPVQGGLVRLLRDALTSVSTIQTRCLLCADVDHLSSTSTDRGWGCGYRNIQMQVGARGGGRRSSGWRPARLPLGPPVRWAGCGRAAARQLLSSCIPGCIAGQAAEAAPLPPAAPPLAAARRRPTCCDAARRSGRRCLGAAASCPTCPAYKRGWRAPGGRALTCRARSSWAARCRAAASGLAPPRRRRCSGGRRAAGGTGTARLLIAKQLAMGPFRHMAGPALPPGAAAAGHGTHAPPRRAQVLRPQGARGGLLQQGRRGPAIHQRAGRHHPRGRRLRRLRPLPHRGHPAQVGGGPAVAWRGWRARERRHRASARRASQAPLWQPRWPKQEPPPAPWLRPQEHQPRQLRLLPGLHRQCSRLPGRALRAARLSRQGEGRGAGAGAGHGGFAAQVGRWGRRCWGPACACPAAVAAAPRQRGRRAQRGSPAREGPCRPQLAALPGAPQGAEAAGGRRAAGGQLQQRRQRGWGRRQGRR
jgi:hypothetical protein